MPRFGVVPKTEGALVIKRQTTQYIGKAKVNLLQWLDKKHIWPSVRNEPNTRPEQRHDWYLITSRRWVCPHFSTKETAYTVGCSACPRSILYYVLFLLPRPSYHRFAMQLARDPEWRELSTFRTLPLEHLWVLFFGANKYRLVMMVVALITMVAAVVAALK